MSQNSRNYSFFWKIVNLDPALLRGIIVAVVALLASVGVMVSDDIPEAVIGVFVAAAAIIQATWTRGAVTPNAKVAVRVPDPVNAPDRIEAGPAVVETDEVLLQSADPATHNLIQVAGTRGH